MKLPFKNKSSKASNPIIDYLNGKLSPKAQHQMERNFMLDPFENEALDGLSKLKSNELEDDLLELNLRISIKTKKHNNIWFKWAAILIAIVVPASLFWLINNRIPVNSEISSTQITPKPQDTLTVIAKATIPDESNSRNTVKFTPPVIKADEEIDENATDDNEMTITTHDYEEQIYADEMIVEVPLTENKDYLTTTPATPEPSSKKILAQPSTRTVKGKVYDDLGEPLPGATVTIADKTKGTVTDFDGNFSLQLEDNDSLAKLKVSFIGFENEIIQPSTNEELAVVLTPDKSEISEVVVVGYGTSKKSASDAISYKAAKPQMGLLAYENELSNELLKKINKPDKALKISLMVHINNNNTIELVEVIKSSHPQYNQTAIDLIKNGPDWISAKENGKFTYDKQRVTIEIK